MTPNHNAYVCIMAGGSGERFWPMSRKQTPKHLIRLFSDTTLLEETVRRLDGVVPVQNIFVLTNAAQLEGVRAVLPFLPQEQIIAEPARRDTAPAAALATALGHSKNPEAVIALLPADALIRNQSAFRRQLGEALVWAANHAALITFSIKPTFAATGYGYLQLEDPLGLGNGGSRFCEVRRFVEKPDRNSAEEYLAAGTFGWNAGMFVWKAKSFLAELDRLAPELGRFVHEFPTQGHAEFLQRRFAELPKISVDFAIMEKAASVHAIVAEFDWDDVGTWTALPAHLPSDGAGNTLRGSVVECGSRNNIVVSNGRTIALCGVDDLIVVETADAILVCHRDAVQDVKKLQPKLAEQLT